MAHPLPKTLECLLNDALVETPPGRSIWVALSGGLDSALLLTLAAPVCRSANRPLNAIHINHGLQAGAADFEKHCQALCQRLNVPLTVVGVTVDPSVGGIEAAARDARYRAFQTHISDGDVVWLAQHQDDQAETLLLAALRGSGIRGLAGMPYRRQAHGLTFVRPWLFVARRCLENRAGKLNLAWCEDPTNSDVAFDRNRLRHEVMPALKARWPEAARALSSSAAHAGEADALLSEYALAELGTLRAGADSVDAIALTTRSRPRQRLLVRTWCQQLLLPTPPQRRLDSLLDQLIAAMDASVHVAWPGAEARVWKSRLYLITPLEPLPAWQSTWAGQPGLDTPLGRLELSLQTATPLTQPATPLTLRWRQGGEVIALAGRGRRDVKRLLQEAQIPPWERERLIMVMADDACLGVVRPPASVLWQAAGVAFKGAK
ncbi:MAG: tRNA lysidine(34) synthetase TilS [Halomonadaceae bacterium]|uniref:tRNA(Ile)-lysidine synthase n=1 Tax=Halomonas colorata TaxID=2742615 RepID=A0ABR9FY49_9GAMM|nr:tRNA lysidine(34) synthetase TilS [Halomonas colorata]MBE0463564.1 tRNA lysidine(34) synthetase TilS [Halomonas colorata]